MIERKARIFNIQKYSVYDGPGIRTLIFFKGCPLRCKWCSNPEGQERKYQLMYRADSCTNCGACASVCPQKIHSPPPHTIDRSKECIGCGACVSGCLSNALSVAGYDVTISNVMEAIEQDGVFYSTSGGGVTLGGGEMSFQPEFAANLLMECRLAGFHTAVETCGYAKLEALLKIAEFTDLFLYDIKCIDSERHYKWTGVHNEIILKNLDELIRRRYNVRIRMPLMKGVNDDSHIISQTMAHLSQYKEYRNFQGIDLLPYHKMGIIKYKQLEKPYPVEQDLSLSDEDLAGIEQQISDRGFPVKIIRH